MENEVSEIEGLREIITKQAMQIADLEAQLRDIEILAKPVKDYMPIPIKKDTAEVEL